MTLVYTNSLKLPLNPSENPPWHREFRVLAPLFSFCRRARRDLLPTTMNFEKYCRTSRRRFTVTATRASGASGATGMVSFFPVLSPGTRAGKKDDTRLYKLPQTTFKPF